MRKSLIQFLIVSVWLAVTTLQADQFPSRAFTTQDGLPVNSLEDILADSHGFLWFASDHGLTRFDGHDFQTFTEDDGLPSNTIAALMQGRDGTLWLGTNKQLCHFRPHRSSQQNAAQEFTTYDFPSPRVVTTIFQDHHGRVWCGTLDGLFVLDLQKPRPKLEPLPLTPQSGGDTAISAIAEDSTGVIWASFLNKLYRLPDGAKPQGFSSQIFKDRISSLLLDGRGRMWMGTWNGLYLLRSKPPGADLAERYWNGPASVINPFVANLFRSKDGKLWALSNVGLTGWDENSAEPQFHKYQDTGGWLDHGLYGMAEDPQGSLWGLVEARGVVRLSRNGLTRFQMPEALESSKIRDVMEDRDHNLIAITRGPVLQVIKDESVTRIAPRIPMKLTNAGWGERQIVLQDHLGEWWMATGQGVLHYPAVPVEALTHTPVLAVYSESNGLPSNEVFRLGEDATGNIWIGTMTGDRRTEPGGISVWTRQTGHLTRLIDESGPSELIADRHGSMWIGWWFRAALQRYRNGRLQSFGEADGLAPGAVHDILFDHAGRLWVASTRGLRMVDNPGGEVLHFRRYSEHDGLTSHRLYSLAEGANHRLYVGSENGLDELDPKTGRLRHYGMQDGLPTEEVLSAFCDSKGVLWFGTHSGLVRLQPSSPGPDQVQLRFTGLIAGGKKWPVSKLGETDIGGLAVDSSHNSLEVRFTDLSFGSAGPLLYEYQAGLNTSWSDAAADRTVTFAGLAPASYTIRVRAVDPVGHIRSAPISLRVTVRPPFWRTWWFEWLLLLTAAGVAWLILHYRIARIMAVQQIRTRISSDLHDDIGSGLSQIAIWSDIALRDEPATGNTSEALERIAAASRSLVDSISHIVWTVNPRRDSLRELLQRIRYFASEICSSHDITLQFNLPERVADRAANSMLRHDVFLLAKEAIYNAARHSDCTCLRIDIEVSSRMLDIRISDNGKGMPAADTPGNGLQTMRQRAQELGGRVAWLTSQSQGTTVHLIVPLTSRRQRALHV